MGLAVGGQAESSPPAVAHKGIEGMDEAKPFLAAATGDATRGSGSRLQPRGVQVGFGESFFPQDKSPGKWKSPSGPRQALACIVWAGTQGPEVPRSLPHPWELLTPNALGWLAGPPSPQEAAARLMSPARPTVLLAANLEVERIPPK